MTKNPTKRKSSSKGKDAISILIKARFRCKISDETLLKLRRDIVTAIINKIKTAELLGDALFISVAMDNEGKNNKMKE